MFCYYFTMLVTDYSSALIMSLLLLFQWQRLQLLQLGVPATFMLVAFDEGPGPPIRYQYAELGKLYSVVSQLVRCCDVSSRMRSSITVRTFLIYSLLKKPLQTAYRSVIWTRQLHSVVVNQYMNLRIKFWIHSDHSCQFACFDMTEVECNI